MKPVISVVIPVYNAETTLRKCVESLVFGTFRSVKIILVDDCSKDKSWNLCQSLADQFDNVKCVQNPENKGVSYTRNHGLAETEGEYVLFVDSDDWVSGRYAESLYQEALKAPDTLPVCGFKLIDQTKGERKDYLWNPAGEHGSKYTLERKDFFELLDQIHIQQLWNKIFRKAVIDEHQLRFDETQSMGEDFQFVLDYIEAAQIERCEIINEPLYYYLRANNTSLMSKFGLTKTNSEYSRLKQLLSIAGEENQDNIQRYDQAIANAKYSAVYQAVHNAAWSKEEKLCYIEQVMGDGNAPRHYTEQNRIYQKEKLAEKLKAAKNLYPRLKGKFRRNKRDRLIEEMKGKLQNRDFSIISQNCIGGVFYHDMGLQFTSPTINLYFTCPDFVKFVLNLDHYLALTPQMTWGEEYPVGYLEDVAICFQHYDSCSEALKKWEERKKRINREKVIVLCTDREDFTEETYALWKRVSYPKVLFTVTNRNAPEEVYYPEYSNERQVGDLIQTREFYKEDTLLNTVNGVVKDKKNN